MIFEFDDPNVGEKYLDLWWKLDGTQRCADEPDNYTENWVNRNIPDEKAVELCKGCNFLEECRAYALAAQEPTGIWGGTTPQMRERILNDGL